MTTMNPCPSDKQVGSQTVELDDVSKSFGNRGVLDGISLEIAAGASVCICGVNGAGKSTLLRLVAGLLRPDAGAVRVCGRDMGRERAAGARRIGFTGHESLLYPDLTPLENLRFYAGLYGLGDVENRIEAAIARVDLAAQRELPVRALSRGMVQRLAFARATLHEPRVLLADEPFSGLDLKASQALVELLRGLTQSGGTVLMTTHELPLAMRCCRRVIVLDRRRVLFDRAVEGIELESFYVDYLQYARSQA